MSGFTPSATTPEQRIAALDEAVMRGGGILKFARTLGITHQAVYHWRRRGWVPLERAITIHAIFKVERDNLIEPRLANALAAHAADLI
jgi:transposase-like protein